MKNKTNPSQITPKDYYNRPSIQSSYKIAVICFFILVGMVLGILIAEVIDDFDNTSIHKKIDPIAEISYEKETIEEKRLRWIKRRTIR